MQQSEYDKILAANPGDPRFAEYAEELRCAGELTAAQQVCFCGLNANPDCHLGRLALAQIFYQQGHIAFAVREIKDLLKRCPELVSLQKLLHTLEPDADLAQLQPNISSQGSPDNEATVAEVEFEFDDLDLIKSDRGKKP